MTHSSPLLERFKRKTEGPCPACGVRTVQFFGKSHCDACVAKQAEAERDAQGALRLEALVSTGMLQHGTAAIRFERADDPGHNAKAWALARGSRRNVWLYGPPGVGKSYLARCLLVDAVLSQSLRAAEVSARRLLKVCARFDEGRGMLLRWERASVLLLDDIDKAPWREDELTALWELFDIRASEGRRTIVTGNMPPGEFAEYLKARIPQNSSLPSGTLDRLKPLDIVQLTGKSLR